MRYDQRLDDRSRVGLAQDITRKRSECADSPTPFGIRLQHYDAGLHHRPFTSVAITCLEKQIAAIKTLASL